jgi:hypothetical protein
LVKLMDIPPARGATTKFSGSKSGCLPKLISILDKCLNPMGCLSIL